MGLLQFRHHLGSWQFFIYSPRNSRFYFSFHHSIFFFNFLFYVWREFQCWHGIEILKSRIKLSLSAHVLGYWGILRNSNQCEEFSILSDKMLKFCSPKPGAFIRAPFHLSKEADKTVSGKWMEDDYREVTQTILKFSKLSRFENLIFHLGFILALHCIKHLFIQKKLYPSALGLQQGCFSFQKAMHCCTIHLFERRQTSRTNQAAATNLGEVLVPFMTSQKYLSI